MSFSVEGIWKSWEKDEPLFKELGKAVQKVLKDAIFEGGMYAEVAFRPKDIISILKKLKSRSGDAPLTYEAMTDKLGVRVICNYQEDISVIDKIIHANFNVKKFDNKAADLKYDTLGYTSYHYDLIFDKHPELTLSSLIFELQLRTINQHAWACTAHELSYKQDIALPNDFKRKVYRLLALYEIADNELSSVNSFITNHEDFSLYKCFKQLEKQFYKLAKISFDKELSIISLKSLTSFLITSELNLFISEFDRWIGENSAKIEYIYTDYKKSSHYSYIILQPEIIFVWFLLEKCEYKLKENWSTYFDYDDLEVIINAWGIIE